MRKTGTRCILGLMLIVGAALSAGCATVGDQRVDLLYQRTVNAKGGSGDLYFVEEGVPALSGTTPIQWVLGEITNKDGEKVGNIVTDTAPADLLTDAFTQEFRAAGYNVIQERPMPQDAAKGVKLKSVTIELKEKKSLVKVDAKCRVKISVEPWRNGKAMKLLEYEAEYSATDIVGREDPLPKTMQQALQTLMTRSVPEIVKMIEQK